MESQERGHGSKTPVSYIDRKKERKSEREKNR
jgi:hypothetical protein